MMDVPDGSLCRITSSAKDLINNVKIVKTDDSLPFYKLVIIKTTEEESEKSDEETSEDDDELFDFKLLSKNFEKEKIDDNKLSKFDKPKETGGEEIVRKPNHYNRHQPYHNKHNNRYYGRRNNNYNKTSKKYKNHSNREENYDYASRDLNSRARGNRGFKSASKRDFSSKVNNHATYNTDNYQHSLQHPSGDFSPQPWINPPVIFSAYSHAALPEKPRNSFGLLGDHPKSYAPSVPPFQLKQNDNYIHDQNSTYTPMASNFQSDTISDNFICDQAASYPPMTSNNHNSFVHNQNSPYSPITSNYPSSKQSDKFVRDQNYWNDSYSNYNKRNRRRNRNKHFNVKNKQKSNSWEKNSRRHPNVRNDTSRNNASRNNSSFDYRN